MGTVLSDIILFNAPFIPEKIGLIGLLLTGVVSLKMMNHHNEIQEH